MIKVQKDITLTIDGEDVGVLGDICEIVRVIMEVDKASDKFSYMESVENGKVRDFIYKIFNV